MVFALTIVETSFVVIQDLTRALNDAVCLCSLPGPGQHRAEFRFVGIHTAKSHSIDQPGKGKLIRCDPHADLVTLRHSFLLSENTVKEGGGQKDPKKKPER